MASVAQLKALFVSVDTHHTGKISRDELLVALQKGGKRVTRADVDRLLVAADTNHDHEIDFYEFKTLHAKAPDKLTALGANLLTRASSGVLSGLSAAGGAISSSPRTFANLLGTAGEAVGMTRNYPVEAKLVSFVQFALHKLEASHDSFEDGTPEEDYKELCSFAEGMSRNLKAAGAGAGPKLRSAIRTGLLPAWDIGNDSPGTKLKGGGADALKEALESLLKPGGPLGDAARGHEQAVEKHAAAHHREAEADASVRPNGLGSMNLDDGISYLWNLDKPQRIEWGYPGGFTLDLQAKKGYDGRDRCPRPLIEYVDESHPFWRMRTTKAFIALLDNYEREVGKAERQTAQEKREESEFLSALMATPVMRFAFEWIKAHAADPRAKRMRTRSDFEHLLFDLWLAPYRRVRDNDSSGFEHVFVGEEKNGEIIGLHNWVQYYLEEKRGKINYLGWSGKQDTDYTDDVNLVTVKFAWQDEDDDVEEKPVSTMLCGSSVEFEMAALTMAFLGGNQGGDNGPITLGNEKINIKCYSQRTRYGNQVGTAYIEFARR